MWRYGVELWKVHRARKAAVAAIFPLVEQSRTRLNGIPDLAWFDPYVVGLMMTLITIIARRDGSIEDSDALAAVQADAWGAITGLKSDLIGGESLSLSAARNRYFEEGCRRGLALGPGLGAAGEGTAPDELSPPEMENAASTDDVAILEHVRQTRLSTLWIDSFDRHIAGLPFAPASV